MKPGALQGAVVGAILTAALIAVSYLGWRLAGLPFVPFDLFDWIARVLPGPVVTFAIDAAVSIIRGLHAGSIGGAAKSGEQVIAVVTVLAGGVAAGIVLHIILGWSDEPALLFGAILGAVLGGLATLVEESVGRVGSGAFVSISWIIGTFLGWGVAFGWAHDRLRAMRGGAGRDVTDARDRAGRRRFLIRLACTTGTPTALTALWGVLVGRRAAVPGSRWSDGHELPNAAAAVVPAAGTRPEFTRLEDHYRIDIDTRMPTIDGSRWRLNIGGLVERPLALALDDLRGEEPVHQFVTLSCISNPIGGDLIGTTRWTGVSLQRLLARIRPQPRVTHLRIASADGFFEVVSLETIRTDPRVMLAYAWDGVPLLNEHGFPLRLYVPDLYGMKQPKWIVGIDAIDRWEPGYWVTRGWDPHGHMRTVSVVDAVDARSAVADSGGRARVPIGGVAHAGARRISRVEARVDEGDWQEARIRDPISETTWVVWRADLSFERGEHVVTVRSYEGDGTPQAGSLHGKRVTV